ncbi:MAG: VWA domain-containing protein [Planctomycetia bacterium]|nr:VWA domain-containing protein [Planctomycetia bacterium]
MHALKRIAEWVLGIPEAEPGQGTAWRVVQHFPWPSWALLLFSIAAAIVVVSIYRRDAALLTRPARVVLASLRLFALGLLLFMLSETSLSIERTGLPFVVVLLDHSGSMATEDLPSQTDVRDSLQAQLRDAGFDKPSRLNVAKSLLLRQNGALLKRLVENHKLRVYTVAEAETIVGQSAYLQAAQIDELLPKLRDVAVQGDQTRLGDALRDVLNGLRGAPPSAIIILSDGITTDGEKLSAAARNARQKSVPLYLVALGNADPVIDLELHNVLADDVAFVNDPVTFSYTLTGHGLSGRTTRVVLKKQVESAVLASQDVTVSDEGRPQKLEITYTPQAAGEIDLVLEAAALPKESNVKNNSESRHVSVRDEKIRVLVVDFLPRWEFRELKALLEREKTVELKTVLQDADPEYVQEDLSALPHFPVTREELYQYDVVIFGDVNLSYLSSSVVENLRAFVAERGRGVLFIAGQHHNPAQYRGTPLETLLPIDLDGLSVPGHDLPLSESFRPEMTVEGRKGSSIFRFADSDQASQEVWKFLPGLFWMVEARAIKPGAIVYATHPSRAAARGKVPLIVTQHYGNGKVLFHATDELWRWRFRTGDVFYGRYWVHVIRYLSRSKLLGKDAGAELTVDHKLYRTGENVGLRVRFAEEKLAPAATDGVTVIVEKSGGAQKKVVLTRIPEASTVFEGLFPLAPEGKYHAWVAAPSFARAPPAEDFEVRASEREMRVLRTDVAELTYAATSTGGKLYTPQTADRLAADIPTGLPVPIEADAQIPLWNHWLTLVAFACVLSTEWILRKRWRLV